MPHAWMVQSSTHEPGACTTQARADDGPPETDDRSDWHRSRWRRAGRPAAGGRVSSHTQHVVVGGGRGRVSAPPACARPGLHRAHLPLRLTGRAHISGPFVSRHNHATTSPLLTPQVHIYHDTPSVVLVVYSISIPFSYFLVLVAYIHR